ncbi:MAG: methylglyoxal synthase [Myxococcota bacterium]
MRSIALIAHDAKKHELMEVVRPWRALLAPHRLVATEHTGMLLEETLALSVSKVLSGPRGGDLQIGAWVATGEISAVIFLRDPLTAHPHELDFSAALKVCDVHNVPLATKEATASLLLRSYVSEVEERQAGSSAF